ncbi:MAG TPA: anti-sigma factor [Anaerolineales bacterium]|nr:anti-sigma factor [Anaerolineales bacterium]
MAEVDPVLELVPAYALGCLDEDEAQRVQEHLGDCAACRAELQTYREVANQLAYSVKQIDPPARVKTSLMARVAKSSATQVNQRTLGESGFKSILERLSGTAPIWAVASLVLVLALVASNVFLWSQVRDLRAALAVTLQVVSLQGSEAAPGAAGLLVISRDGEHGTLVVDDLPVLDETQQYQLWLIWDGERSSGGVFSVRDDGYGSLWISAPKALDSYSAFGITIEPEGGSPQPTGVRVLAGDL